jgi:NAD(P)-dependent dehydrogenase (short-subunit alcohol dehydrogenase family)
MSSPLADRVVLVTGAARGIGAATARLAAARGARVALAGLEPDLLAAVAADLPGPAGRHAWFPCDVTRQSTVDEAVAGTVAALGGIDVVVANAGVANHGTVAVAPVDALVRTIEVNLLGVVRTVKATLPFVAERHGHYLLVSSGAAFLALPGMAAYAASKAGVEHFGNALRLETAHLGVTVGSAHMLFVDTDLVRDIQADLPSTRDALRRAAMPVDACARAFVTGLERRRRRVYLPRGLGAVQVLRGLLHTAAGDWRLRRSARTSVPEAEREVLALGRSFGTTSAAESTVD